MLNPNSVSRFRVLFAALALVSICPTSAQTTRSSRASLGKNSPAVKEAFDDVVAAASNSTVRIRGNGTETLGTIVSADGLIVTKASELKSDLRVTLKDQRQFPARVIGIVEAVDLAMLKIEAADLTPIQWGDATEIDDGMWVASPGIWKDPVAVGMISLPGRRKVQLKAAYLGVLLEEADKGARIQRVVNGSGAQKAGLKPNDIIMSVNSSPVVKREDVGGIIGDQQVGAVVKLHILREGDGQDVEVTLGPIAKEFSRENGRGANMNKMGTSLSGRRAGFPAVIQHDSPLSANTCGGPLVTLDGKVIGINIARSGRVESFALPSDVVQSYLEDLKDGKYAPTTQPTTAPSTQP